MATIDLVDRILRQWGKGPAKWPEGDIPSTADGTIEYKAYTVLDDLHLREIRRDHWNIFRVRNRKYTPDVSNNIDTEATLYNVRAGISSKSMNVTVRNGMLWDVTEDTDEFTSPVHLDAEEFLALDSCPLHYQDYLVAAAAIEFGEIYRTELTFQDRAYEQRKAELRAERDREYRRARHIDARQKNVNVMWDDPEMWYAMGARISGPMRRNP